MRRKKRKKTKSKKDNERDSETEEYGVVLTKEKKYQHRIYPQKGKVPKEEEDDSYKVV
ncbi:MAG: hypothetical protein ACW98D_06875 [Promethearchaeota archaeon]|jgi:hypothetical protein